MNSHVYQNILKLLRSAFLASYEIQDEYMFCHISDLFDEHYLFLFA